MTREKGTVWMVCVLVFDILQTASGAGPVLTIPAGSSVVLLPEKEAQQTELVSGITCSGAVNNDTRIYIRSIIPSNPCGRCFQIWPCTAGYCLTYTPGQGSLSFTSAPSYVIQLECTDEVDTDVGTIQVRLEANTPPRFTNPAGGYGTKQVFGATGKRAGDFLYDVDALDSDGDAVLYTLTTDPQSDLFEIGHTDGKIRVTKDLRLMCEDSINMYVTIFDSYNSPVGPGVVDVRFKAGNVYPQFKNTEREVTIAEDPDDSPPTLNRQVLPPFIIKDNQKVDMTFFKLRAVPEEGLDYYYLDKKGGKVRIRTRKKLDYEYLPLRTVQLYVDYNDGFCNAETYSLTVKVTDVPETPVILPATKFERTVYEGFITLDPGWRAVDPDESETLRWSLLNDAGGTFIIDTETGIIHSKGDYDVDPNVKSKVRNLQARVLDKDGKRSKADLKLTILDKNDNVPVFLSRLYQMSASPCTKVGAIIGRINAQDKDSEFQGNDAPVYSGTGGNITVLATGEVTLQTVCVVGQTETIQAFVTDQGTYPGPLSGVPTTITFTCNPCPVPLPNNNGTTTTTTTNNNGNMTGASGDGANKADFLALNLGWIVPAILLALILASLLGYAIWRYVTGACARCRARMALRRKPTKPKVAKPKPAKEEPKKDKRPTPPEPPPPEPEPFFFGFWKETYPDRDQRHTPRRDVKPASVEEDKKVEEKERQEEEKEKEQRRLERQKAEEKYRKELEKYHKELEARNNPAPKKKKSFCSIL